jgi:polyribonucleotide nucleotidyltransferase
MKEALPEPRPDISPYAPRIINIFINPSKVGEVIGPGGKIIKKIIAETKTKIEIDESGKITIASSDMEAVKQAEQMIKDITEEAEVNKTYNGKVVRIEDYGAFIQILPNVDGLLHVSEISHQRVRNVRDVIKMGQTLLVKVIFIDENNKIRLSKKALEHSSQHDNNPHQKHNKDGHSSYRRSNKDRY